MCEHQLLQVAAPQRDGVGASGIVRHAPAHVHLGGDTHHRHPKKKGKRQGKGQTFHSTGLLSSFTDWILQVLFPRSTPHTWPMLTQERPCSPDPGLLAGLDARKDAARVAGGQPGK